ncbi:hypothetical protein Y1Q_0003205 [Alligator mississippiensis]|uniref:Uncharacterized protein n=1 Tax=Alligator mississippiensis TaxID=8496 RepID=A0A151ME78_ALLMI|nr:hypothetical protein Y1Q_0003205 [Alligator mississippiensis]
MSTVCDRGPSLQVKPFPRLALTRTITHLLLLDIASAPQSLLSYLPAPHPGTNPSWPCPHVQPCQSPGRTSLRTPEFPVFCIVLLLLLWSDCRTYKGRERPKLLKFAS